MNRKDFVIILVLLTAIAGCSSNQYPVTYNTSPVGAQLYCNGIAKGYTPVTLYYELDKETKERGYLNTLPCDVKWVSGATNKAHRTFYFSEFPNGVITTMTRPNVAGYEKDTAFALKVQMLKAQQAQARAAQNAAAAAQYSAYSAANAVYQMRRPKTCFNNGFSVTCY